MNDGPYLRNRIQMVEKTMVHIFVIDFIIDFRWWRRQWSGTMMVGARFQHQWEMGQPRRSKIRASMGDFNISLSLPITLTNYSPPQPSSPVVCNHPPLLLLTADHLRCLLAPSSSRYVCLMLRGFQNCPLLEDLSLLRSLKEAEIQPKLIGNTVQWASVWNLWRESKTLTASTIERLQLLSGEFQSLRRKHPMFSDRRWLLWVLISLKETLPETIVVFNSRISSQVTRNTLTSDMDDD